MPSTVQTHWYKSADLVDQAAQRDWAVNLNVLDLLEEAVEIVGRQLVEQALDRLLLLLLLGVLRLQLPDLQDTSSGALSLRAGQESRQDKRARTRSLTIPRSFWP